MEDLIKQLQIASDFKEELIFVEFKYIEIRDLLKHFLTLISASLVFSFTFSEKIIDFQNATLIPKLLLYSSWGILVLSLGCCGYGLYTNYLAAEIAVEKISEISNESFRSKERMSYTFQDLSAVLYGVGLTLLISTSLFKMKKAK